MRFFPGCRFLRPWIPRLAATLRMYAAPATSREHEFFRALVPLGDHERAPGRS